MTWICSTLYAFICLLTEAFVFAADVYIKYESIRESMYYKYKWKQSVLFGSNGEEKRPSLVANKVRDLNRTMFQVISPLVCKTYCNLSLELSCISDSLSLQCLAIRLTLMEVLLLCSSLLISFTIYKTRCSDSALKLILYIGSRFHFVWATLFLILVVSHRTAFLFLESMNIWDLTWTLGLAIEWEREKQCEYISVFETTNWVDWEKEKKNSSRRVRDTRLVIYCSAREFELRGKNVLPLFTRRSFGTHSVQVKRKEMKFTPRN